MKAAELALANKSFVEKSIKVNEEGKSYLYKSLDSMGIRYIPTHANFVCIELPHEARDIFEDLLLLGVIVRPLTFYGRNNSIRVTIGTKEENQEFIKCLKQVLKKVENL